MTGCWVTEEEAGSEQVFSLEDLDVAEVSIVGRPAIRRKFLIIKRDDTLGDPMIEKQDPVRGAVLLEEWLLSLDEESKADVLAVIGPAEAEAEAEAVDEEAAEAVEAMDEEAAEAVEAMDEDEEALALTKASLPEPIRKALAAAEEAAAAAIARADAAEDREALRKAEDRARADFPNVYRPEIVGRLLKEAEGALSAESWAALTDTLTAAEAVAKGDQALFTEIGSVQNDAGNVDTESAIFADADALVTQGAFPTRAAAVTHIIKTQRGRYGRARADSISNRRA